MMRLLALVQSSPGLLFGMPIYFLIFGIFLHHHLRINKRILFNTGIGLALIILTLILQIVFRNGNSIIEAMVSDQTLRSNITKGMYSMENGASLISSLRLIIFAMLTGIFITLFDMKYSIKEIIPSLFSYSIGTFLLVFALSMLLGADVLKSVLSRFSSLDASNFLTIDRFGYRISGFFNEPSHSSVFIGTVMAAMFSLSRDAKSKVLAIIGLLFVFFLARSVTIFAIFGAGLFLLRASSGTALVSVFAVFYIQNAMKLIADNFGSSGLFRSVYERTFRSEIFGNTLTDSLFGFDFGQVYSFEPIKGIMLQLGVVGVIALYFISQRSLQVFSFAILCFSAIPQMWYYPPWAAIGLFAAVFFSKGNLEK